MSRKASLRMGTLLTALILIAEIVHHYNLNDAKLNVLVTAAVAAITAVYALLTFEILQQNQAMAKASVDSSVTMERTLRFSHSATLLFSTISTKNPIFINDADSIHPIENEDYRRATSEFASTGEEREFVFAVVRNLGQGSATNVKLMTRYDVIDSSSANRESTIQKTATIPVLEPDTGVALCVFISRIPTHDDEVKLLRAECDFSDLYKDAIGDSVGKVRIFPADHNAVQGTSCVIRLA